MSDTLSAEDYEKLKAFVAVYMERYADGPVAPEVHPLFVLRELEKASATRAKKGLILAVQDLVESTADWPPEKVAQAEHDFARAGAFGLGELRRRYSRRFVQVMKRGAIRTSLEYYLLKNIVDGSSIEMGASEAESIFAMLAEYERRVTGKA